MEGHRCSLYHCPDVEAQVYIKTMVRRFRANNALRKTRDALLGERGEREGHTTQGLSLPLSRCSKGASIGRGSSLTVPGDHATPTQGDWQSVC